jgi:hypothetical protein
MTFSKSPLPTIERVLTATKSFFAKVKDPTLGGGGGGGGEGFGGCESANEDIDGAVNPPMALGGRKGSGG